MRSNQIEELTPILPEFLEPVGAGSGRRVPGAWLETRTYHSAARPLTGTSMRIDGLNALPTDVLVRVTLLDGMEHSALLRSGNESFTIPELATRVELATSYWQMGTIHILEGFDHLLFLLTLLAVEVVHKNAGEVTLSERFPWLIAFTFGLVHGLGFAGALSEIGVPQNEVPLALLMFNVGVETGQVMFVIAVSLLLAGLHRLYGPARASYWPARAPTRLAASPHSGPCNGSTRFCRGALRNW